MNNIRISRVSQVFKVYLDRLGIDHCEEALEKTLQQTNSSLVDTSEYLQLLRTVQEIETLLRFNNLFLTNLSEKAIKSLGATETAIATRAIQQLASYPTLVDYAIPFAELIQKCRCRQVSPSINSDNFPQEKKEPEKIDIQIVELNRSISINNSKLELANRNLEPASLYQFLTTLIKYPELQLQNPVAIVAASWKNSHKRYYFPFVVDQPERKLDLCHIYDRWCPNWRVAAYPKIE
jgi:hypothetical protein